MSIRKKSVDGFSWQFLDLIFNQGFQFGLVVYLSSKILPEEFGLVAIATFFVALSQAFVESGFSSAIIRKTECTEIEFSSVFFFNLIVGSICSVLLFFLSYPIALLYNDNRLISIIQILSTAPILLSFGIVQQAIKTKELNFKFQTIISISSSIFSGIIAVYSIHAGVGYLTLPILTITRFVFSSTLYWLFSSWRPIPVFDFKSIKDMLRFGSNLILNGLIEVAYKNIYTLFIGKVYSTNTLGQYTRADQIQSMASVTLNKLFGKVTFPILSKFQNDDLRLLDLYKSYLSVLILISSLCMMTIWITSDELVFFLFGSNWSHTSSYLDVLCFVGLLYITNAINGSLLKVKGKSIYILRLGIVKKIIAIPIIIIAVNFSIESLLYAILAIGVFEFILNSYWSGRLVNFSMSMQLKSILPPFLVCFISGILVNYVAKYIYVSALPKLIVICLINISLVFILSFVLNLNSFRIIQTLLFQVLSRKSKKL